MCVCVRERKPESMGLSVSQARPRTLGLPLHSSPGTDDQPTGEYICECVFHCEGVYFSSVLDVCVCAGGRVCLHSSGSL